MSLELILGSMFAGKSSMAIQKVRRAQSLGWKCCVLTSAIDVRYDSSASSIRTHSTESMPAIGVRTLLEALYVDTYLQAKLVIIEEGQFFPDLYDVVMRMVEEDMKEVIVVGLDGDANRKPFGQILDLIPKADSYMKLTAFCKLCKDGTPGIFSAKVLAFADANAKAEEKQICVGAEDMYMAVCRKHYLERL